MRKGINQWSLPDEWDLRTCFSVAKEAGFDGVELVLGEPSSEAGAPGAAEHLGSPLRYLGFHPYANDEFSLESTPDDVAAVRSLADEVGVRVPSISTVMPFLYPLSSQDPEVRGRGVEVLRKALAFGEIVGAESLLVVPGVVGPGTSYPEALERSRASLEELAPHAERHGVVLAVENVWNQMLVSPIEFRDFVDSVDSRYVRAYVDVGNAVRTGFGDDWLRILGERVDKVHVCNFRGEVGNLTGFTRHLLDGDVDWPAVMDALRAIRYDGWVTAEITPPAPHYPEKVVRDVSTAMDWIFAGGEPAGGAAKGGSA